MAQKLGELIDKISIHALREEGDQQKQRQNLYFLINYTTFCTNLEES